MDELLKFINEFDEKHNDPQWCDEFIECVFSCEEKYSGLKEEDYPISMDRLGEMLQTVVKNLSIETKLKIGMIGINEILKDKLLVINTENIKKYKKGFISQLRAPLPDELINNSDLLEFCLENNLRELVFCFDASLFTPEIINKYGKIIVDSMNHYQYWLGDRSYYSSRTGGTPKNTSNYDIEKTHLYENINLMELFIKNRLYHISKSFFYRHSEWFNASLFKKYPQELVDFFRNVDEILVRKHVDNMEMFEFCCTYGVENFINLYIKNKPELFTDDFIISHKDGMNAYFKKYGIPSIINQERLDSLISKDIIDFGIDKELALYKLEYLSNVNDEILNTIVPYILKFDFDMSFLSRITLYKEIQARIIKLSENSLKIFYRVAKILDDDSLDLTSIINKFLDNIKKYEHLLNGVDVNNLSDEEITNFLEIIIINCDYGITDSSELQKERFVTKRKEYFSHFTEKIEKRQPEEIRETILQKQYGISLETGKFIVERYSCDYKTLIKSGIDERIIKIIFGIKTIIDCDSKEKLIEIFKNSELIDYNVKVNLESEIRKCYAQIYNKTLYKINENTKKCDDPQLQNVVYNGKKIEIYEMNEDFAMQIHALGAYREYTRPENFKDDWNRPKITNHGVCTSYITNSQIATARPSHPIIGFDEYEESALLMAGNYDLGSSNTEFDISSSYPHRMLPPKAMIDSTRHNHNEMVIERCKRSNIRKSLVKRQPGYIVYIVDTMDNKENFNINNPLYQETLQAAADFGIPIVIIDRAKYSEREMNKCNHLEEEFKNSHSLETLNELMITYFNNNVGGRFFTTNNAFAGKNLFTDGNVVRFYNRIVDFILNNISNKNEQIVILNDIIRILNNELKNYAVSHMSYEQPKPFDFDEAIQKLNEQIVIIQNSMGSKEESEELVTNRSR